MLIPVDFPASGRPAAGTRHARFLDTGVHRTRAPAEAFLSAVSPGVLALFFQNRFYVTQEEYLFALADAMKHEYDAICAAGLLLQVDCPTWPAGATRRSRG